MKAPFEHAKRLGPAFFAAWTQPRGFERAIRDTIRGWYFLGEHLNVRTMLESSEGEEPEELRFFLAHTLAIRHYVERAWACPTRFSPDKLWKMVKALGESLGIEWED